jgi:uncharacterized membrane protein
LDLGIWPILTLCHIPEKIMTMTFNGKIALNMGFGSFWLSCNLGEENPINIRLKIKIQKFEC